MSAQLHFIHGPSEANSRNHSFPVTASNQERPRMVPTTHADLLDGVMAMLGHRIAVYAGLRRTMIAAERGLTVGDLRVLDLIIELAPLHTGQLRRLSGLSSGNITSIIDRLEGLGMIHRAKHPTDRRITLLTPDAERCAELDALSAPARGKSRPMPDAETLKQVHAFLTHYLGEKREDTLGNSGQ
ncbi:MarR family transcriptional regulator [Pigmentiphaga aceris]|nr:MarR family transcriptional regulator [Pigmentiphaga aceris]